MCHVWTCWRDAAHDTRAQRDQRKEQWQGCRSSRRGAAHAGKRNTSTDAVKRARMGFRACLINRGQIHVKRHRNAHRAAQNHTAERQGATRTQEGSVIVACAMCGRAGGMQRTTHAHSVTSAKSSGRDAEGVFSTLLGIITKTILGS